MPVAIAGMHRSGTSMVARLLDICGVDLGGAANFAPPAPDNRDGFWEDLRFVRLNERILDCLAGAWDLPPPLPEAWVETPDMVDLGSEGEALARSRRDPWGWKDPRTSLTAPFWNRVLPGLRFVACVRSPLEVAASLQARGYTSLRFGIALWRAYHHRLDADTPPEQVLVVHYRSFFHDPATELDRLLAFVERSVSSSTRAAAIASARASSRHQCRPDREVDDSPLVSSAVRTLYRALCARAGPVCEPALRADERVEDIVAANPRRTPEQEAEALRSLFVARDEELAAIKPVLLAREAELEFALGSLAASREELASIKPILRARDEQIASVLAVLAARDEELASIKPVLQARDEELASIKPILQAREEELRATRARLDHQESEVDRPKA